MRTRGRPSELLRLAAPLSGLLDFAWQRMHWWVATMAVLYALSGITVVKSDEVALILRWGRVVGATPALQEHGSGLLFAFPKPVDQVVRVPVKRVWEVSVSTLNTTGAAAFGLGSTLDPLTQGYALTGDHNVVHAEMVARYRVREPAEWAFYGPRAEDVLRVEVTAAMVRSLGEMGVDRVLSDGRKALVATAARRAQAGLDAAHSGLEISSLELTRLAPPLALAGNFDAVQSAFIGAQTKQNTAQAYRQSALPRARAEADGSVQTARGASLAVLAKARAEGNSFLALSRQYRANPPMVRERLYRDALDQTLDAAGSVRWVPPPSGGAYHGFRLTVGLAGRPDSDADTRVNSVAPPSIPERDQDE